MATKLIAPRTGEGVEELTITNWLKQVGDPVSEMEPIVEIETDKVATEFPSPTAGILLRIDVPQGGVVKVGESMGLIGQPGEELADAPEATGDKPQAQPDVPSPDVLQAEADLAQKPEDRDQTGKKAAFLSPLVKKMLEEHQLDPARISGTGMGGRITKQDVLAFLDNPQPKQSIPPQPEPMHMLNADQKPFAPADSNGTLIPHSSARRQIAKHMLGSKQTSPHVLTVMEVDMSRVLAHRKANKEKFAQDGINLTLTAYFVAAIAAALADHKTINASWTEEGLFVYHEINIGMAVAMGEGGLIVPVIRQAQNLSLKGIAGAINDLSSRARGKKLSPDEVKGGTFTLTNHGTGGSLFAFPVINQPQLGILGTGTMQKRAIVISDEAGNDAIAIRPMIYLSFVFDHRAIDGESADNFLADVKKRLENWSD
jgi:2-oxoglutarate dehydrogenase E2 component (dihydrolipoamide succinyltransferase)